MRKSHLLAMALAGGCAFAAPALAQDGGAAALPTCSAKVTDHCMQREHHAMAAHHHTTKHQSHHGGKRHHK